MVFNCNLILHQVKSFWLIILVPTSARDDVSGGAGCEHWGAKSFKIAFLCSALVYRVGGIIRKASKFLSRRASFRKPPSSKVS